MPRKSHKNKVYSAELKLQAVQDYLSGKGSLRQICRKYEIMDKRQLRNWISCYNSHKDFKAHSCARGEIYMTKGRKTTQQEPNTEVKLICADNTWRVTAREDR